MTSKEAIERIKHLLFGAQSFGMLKTKDGVELKVEGDVELSKAVYIITPDGELPAADADYEMEDGMLLKVKEGMIDNITYPKVEDETEVKVEVEAEDAMVDEVKVDEEVKMVSAELIDGTIVENDAEELQVGDALFVVTEEGRQPAPDSVHETTEGKLITTEGGLIVKIEDKPAEEIKVDETVTEELNFDELLEVFTVGFNHLRGELDVLKESYDNLQANFNKFSAEPAGEKLYSTHKQEYVNEKRAQEFSKLEALKALKQKKTIK